METASSVPLPPRPFSAAPGPRGLPLLGSVVEVWRDPIQFFEDAMTRDQKDRNGPTVKPLLDLIVEPMTKVCVAGDSDERTQSKIVKFLSDARDPRGEPCLTKVLKDFKPEGGNEVKHGRPHDGLDGRQHPRRHHGGDRVGSVVKAVDEVEHQGDGDDEDDERQGVHRPTYPIFSMMPSITLTTSSHRSVTSSRVS